MSTLRELREQLKPVYHHYTDAVISMIGTTPSEKVLQATRESNLALAHQHQVEEHFRGTEIEWKRDATSIPKWFSKPIPKPKYRKKLDELIKQIGNRIEIGHDTLAFGRAETVFGLPVAEGRAFIVHNLQQRTKGMTSKEARRFEGWQHAVMKEIEKQANEMGYDLILFNSGEPFSKNNVSDRPIHHEILEIYGRLPLQHGYHLETIGQPVLRRQLWWVKRLR